MLTLFCSLGSNNGVGPELTTICDVECGFYVVPLVAMVLSKSSTVYIARHILQMLGPNGGKLVAMFNSRVFRRLNDRNGSDDAGNEIQYLRSGNAAVVCVR